MRHHAPERIANPPLSLTGFVTARAPGRRGMTRSRGLYAVWTWKLPCHMQKLETTGGPRAPCRGWRGRSRIRDFFEEARPDFESRTFRHLIV